MNTIENNFSEIVDVASLEAQMAELAAKINAAKTAHADKVRAMKTAVMESEAYKWLTSNGVTMTFSDEVSKARGPVAGAPVAPKYRNPKAHEETWTGRGIAPDWVQEYAETVSKAFKAARKSGDAEKIKAVWTAEKETILKGILIPSESVSAIAG